MYRLILVVPIVMSHACSGNAGPGSPTTECSANSDCGGGAACVAGTCETLCASDTDCGTGNDCESGKICSDGLCKPGCRSGVPVITGLDGDGTEDTGPADGRGSVTTHHIQTELTIAGTDLDGAGVALLDVNGESIPLSLASVSTTKIVAAVPESIGPGEHTLVVSNAAGSAQATTWIVRGEAGPAGPSGPSGPQGPPPDPAAIQSAVSAMGDLDVPNLAGRPAAGYQRTDRWGRFFETETDFVSANVDVGAVFSAPDPTASGGLGRKVEYGDSAGVLYEVMSTDVGELLANGPAIVEARMKVFDSASAHFDEPIVTWRCGATTGAGFGVLASMNIQPQSFGASDTWKTFFLQCPFAPHDIDQIVTLEYLRSDQTDLSVDFVRVSPAPHAGRGTTAFGGNVHLPEGRTIYAPGRLHVHGTERLYLLNQDGVHVSTAWGGTGDLHVGGTIYGEVNGNVTGNLTGSAQSVGNAKIFRKGGNNGTVTCQAFCAGSQWGRTGACLGGYRVDDSSDDHVDCTSTISPQGSGYSYACICVTGN